MWTTLCEYTYTVCWGPGRLSSVRSARGPGVVRAASGTALLIATEHAAIVVWRPGADFRLRLSYTSRLRCAERCNGSRLYNQFGRLDPPPPSTPVCQNLLLHQGCRADCYVIVTFCHYLRQRRRYMFLPVFVCLSVC